MQALQIDDEFKNLIPALSDEEFKQLEENILRDGIQDPLKVWNGILIDGHNRYEIATKHNLPFKVIEMNFDSRNDVIQWIIQNQFGRRNISQYTRICLALKMKPIIAAQAKENQGNRTDLTFVRNLTKVDTKKEIAKLAGVSHDTIAKVEKIQKLSTQVKSDDVIQALMDNELSISAALNHLYHREAEIAELKADIQENCAKVEKNLSALRIYENELRRRLDAETLQQNEKEEILKLLNGIEILFKFQDDSKNFNDTDIDEFVSLVESEEN